LARRGTLRYVTAKFVRRHRAGAGIAAAVAVALTAAAATVMWEARIAHQERNLAQQRFDDVRGLAGAVIFDLAGKIAAVPGTTEARRDLVAVALKYLDSLARDRADDPALERELGAAYLRIGRIQGDIGTQNLGNLPSALESYAKAERLARALVARQPSANAWHLLGDVLTSQMYGSLYANQPEQAAAKANEALQIARQRVRAEPASEDAQGQLGSALHAMAEHGDPKAGRPFLIEEAAVYQRLAARDPKNTEFLRDAALAHKYLADLSLGSGDQEGAFPHLQRAEELDRACARAAPNNPTYKMDLSNDLGLWGGYYEGKQEFTKAIPSREQSLAIRRELVAGDPKDVHAQERLAFALTRLGDDQVNVSPRQALVSYQEAKSIAERLTPESLRAARRADVISSMGDAYRKLGDEERACAAYAEYLPIARELAKRQLSMAANLTHYEKLSSTCPGGHR
jgi:tetratricopeptide (TPR) repeat protein